MFLSNSAQDELGGFDVELLEGAEKRVSPDSDAPFETRPIGGIELDTLIPVLEIDQEHWAGRNVHVRPSFADEDRAEEGHVQAFDHELAERIFRDGFRSVTPNGVLGDARGMTVEIGERCIANAADGIAAVFDANGARRTE